jgi:hypothetical protein
MSTIARETGRPFAKPLGDHFRVRSRPNLLVIEIVGRDRYPDEVVVERELRNRGQLAVLEDLVRTIRSWYEDGSEIRVVSD